MPRLALVGDHDPSVTAHRAIPLALGFAREALGSTLEWDWIGTASISDPRQSLRGASAVWVVPASPYRSMDGALAAIRHAREQRLPFLGTCGGFQHALIEFARNVAGIAHADHAETAAAVSVPSKRNARAEGTRPICDEPPPRECHESGDTYLPTPALIVTPLACSLVEKSGGIAFAPGSQLHAIFGGRTVHEGYHCSYGVNPAYRAQFEAAGLRFTGFDAAGLPPEASRAAVPAETFHRLAQGADIRACELPAHPFFIGTLFQPERSALRGERHPLIEAFVRAAG